MKTTFELINLRMELTEATLKTLNGKITDYTRAMALKHSYQLLKPIYKLK